MMCRVATFFLILYFIFNTEILAQQDSVKVKELLDKAYSLELTNKDSALLTYRKAKQIANELGYHIGEGRATGYMGIVHSNYGNNDSAIYYYKQSLPIYEVANYKGGVASTFINIGNAHQFLGDYQSSMDNYIKGIEIYEQLKDTLNLIIAYENMASLFNDFRMWDKSILYLEKALNLSKLTKDTLNIAYTANDLGNNIMKHKDVNEGLKYLKIAEEVMAKVEDPDIKYYVFNNLFEYNYEIGDSLEAYNYALKSYEEALNTKKPYIIANANNSMSRANLILKNIEGSLRYANEALKISNEIDAKEHQMNANYNLSKIHEKKRDYKKAYEAIQQYIVLEDSVFGEKQQEYITRLENLYQLNAKDNEILRNQLALETSETNLQKSKAQNLIYGIIALLVAGLAFIFWYRARQRKKLSEQTIETLKREQELQAVAALIKGEDRERERIARDLHDSVNGSLAALKLQLESVPSKNLNQFDAKKLDTSMQLIDNTCERIRNISHNLAPPSLINSSLIEALESYCSKINDAGKIEVSFQHHGDIPKLPQKSEITLYHIAQELIQNSLKHSGGNKVLVQLYCDDSEYHLTVEDNGNGYDVKTVKKGMGLNNIQSRVDFLSGSIEVISDQQGTSTTLIFHGEKSLQL